MRLKNKVVMVTGASKGIGRAMALGVAKEGARVIVNYNTDSAGAEKVVKEIAQFGQSAIAIQCNVADVSEINRMFLQVDEAFGQIDVLVNNAGITGWTDLFQITEQQWDDVLDTNLKGTFFCSLEAARRMRENGGGSIINVSTNCAALAVKNLAAYASSKGGVHALTKQLACELASYGIRVNTFAPGPTNVERNLNDDVNYRDIWAGVIPLGRTADPEEMIGPALFLACEDSSYMTGQVFYVDGGWSVQGMMPGNYFQDAMKKRVESKK